MKNTISMVVIIFVSIFVMASAAYAYEGGKRISADGYFGCINRDYFEKMISYTVQNDKVAFEKKYISGILTGQCTKFNVGEEVFIVDTAIFSGLAKVRRRGSTAGFWTLMGAVK